MSSRRARQRGGSGKSGWLGRAAAVTGLGAFLLLVAAYVGVRKYLHSEGFRRLLSEEASRTLGVPGSFKPFHWDGLQVETSAFEAGGEGPVQSLTADNLHVEVGLGGVTHGVWHLRGANVGRIDAVIDQRSSAPDRNEVKPPVNEKASEAKKNGWLPSKVVLDDLTIQAISARVLLNKGTASLSGMQVKVEPQTGQDAYRATVLGGRVLTPWKLVPPVDLDRARVRYQDGDVFLTDARAKIGSHGLLTAEGDYSAATHQITASGDVTDIDCAEILNADWSKRLTGTAASTFSAKGKGTDTNVHGKLTITGGTLTALPFLDTLSAYADTRRFRVITLTEAHAEWTWRDDTTVFDQLVLGSEGLVRLEGSITIKKGFLDGRFRLGLAPGTLATIPGAETDVFLPGERGLLWTPLHITGTLDDPKEDLTDRLVTAAGARMFEVIPQTGEKVLKFTSKVVGDAPAKVLDQAPKVIDKGVEVIGKAADVTNEIGNALDGFLGRKPEPPPAPPQKK